LVHKKLFAVVVCLFLVLAFSGVAKSKALETQSVYSLEYGGLKIDVKAPELAYPGDNITLTVKTEAVAPKFYVKYLNIVIKGRVNATNEIYLKQISHLTNSFLSIHEANYTIEIPEDISGLTYGVISCAWEFMGSSQTIPPSGFPLTYVRNMELEQLQAEYNSLNATYQQLLQNYTTLESSLNAEIESTQNLMYVFIATTAIAGFTVIVMLMRKPKRVWI